MEKDGDACTSANHHDHSTIAITPSPPVGKRRVRAKDLLRMVPEDDEDAQERLQFLLRVRSHLKKRLSRWVVWGCLGWQTGITDKGVLARGLL